MKLMLLIFLGGGLGSVCRHLLNKAFGNGQQFPVGTLLANLLACLFLGFVVGYATARQNYPNELKTFLIVGFCGGFSTFSAFSYQNLEMIQSGQNWLAVFYIAASVVLCLLACWSGLFLARLF